MNAMYVYLIASSGFFLLSWVVLLLVAYALAFQGDSVELVSSATRRQPSPAAARRSKTAAS